MMARIATFTCSDTRTAGDDESGARLRELLEAAGQELVPHVILADDRRAIGYAVRRHCDTRSVDAVILTGGTGVRHQPSQERRSTTSPDSFDD